MTKLQEYKEKAIAYRVRTKWENGNCGGLQDFLLLS